jgi:hypothetical protein
MKRSATILALGAVLSLAMAAPSFAQGTKSPAHKAQQHRVNADAYSNYYDSAVPEGSYTGYPNANTGGYSGAMGGVGR